METLTAPAVNINTLSADQRKALLADLAAQDKAEKQKRTDDIEAFKNMADDFVYRWINRLVDFASQQTELVDTVTADTKPLIDLKQELYNVKEKQDSHTFTHRDGLGSIRVGYNTIIGYDGTASAGIQKVKQYLASLSEDSVIYTKISKILNVLMKPDKNGNLNPVRATELSNLKADIDDELFSDGVDTIIAAQFKTRTSTYVGGWMLKTLENGKEVKVQFRITAQ